MTIWRMCIAYWITKAIDAHSEYIILNAFHSSNGYANVLHFYTMFKSTLPLVFKTVKLFYSTIHLNLFVHHW